MKQRNIFIGLAVLVFLVIAVFAFSGGNKSSVTGNVILDSSSLAGNPDKVTIYFFWGDGCPHCAAEKPFLESLGKKYKDKIEIKMFETWKNPENANLFQEVASTYGIKAEGVPTTFIGEKNWIGYADYMGEEIEDYVKYCIENKCESPLEESCEEEDFCKV